MLEVFGFRETGERRPKEQLLIETMFCLYYLSKDSAAGCASYARCTLPASFPHRREELVCVGSTPAGPARHGLLDRTIRRLGRGTAQGRGEDR